MFKAHRYNDKYYKRHYDQYRGWENAVGKYVVDITLVSSIIDIGCGVGSYLEGAFHAGCKDIQGLEISFESAKPHIVEDILPYISYGDATQNLGINRKFDCALSFEVAEHIEPSGTERFIDNLTSLSNDYIIMTAAPPGQAGTGHINLKPKEFWVDSLEAKGFKFQDQLVQIFWPKWKSFGVAKYILRNLMVFRK